MGRIIRGYPLRPAPAAPSRMRADCDMMRRNPGSLSFMNTHPLTIVLGIVALVAALGIVISLIRASALMRGYEDLRNEVGALSKKLKADVFRDRKSTRLNSSHSQISYAVFCLKKKK